MRTISAADDALLTAPGGRTTFLRVDVKDGGGTFRDLTSYPGLNLVEGATWGEGVDDPGMTATVTLKREVEQLSLAPLMQNSPLNLAFAYPGSFDSLLELGREVKIYTLDLPDGMVPSGSSTWRLMFHGAIDHVAWGGAENVELTCCDLQGDIRDAFIERERVYAYASPADADATKGLYTFAPGETYAVGDLLSPSEANRNGHFYKATSITTGIAGATEPVWPTTAGGTVTSGGVTFTEVGPTTISTGTAVETVIQQLLNDNMTSPPTLTTPSSPLWLVKLWQQDRVQTWEAIRALATQIGWDLRFWFNSGTGGFRLELRQPDRSKLVPDRTFAPSDKIQVSRIELDRGGIRNVVQVWYWDSAILDEAKQPTRQRVKVQDSASITKYKRRFCELAEPSKGGNIDTAAEATTLANAILSDLATPLAEKEVDLPFFFAAELGDLYRFTGDNVYHSGSLDLAVVKYEHKVDGMQARTTLTCRGKPSGGYTRWLAKLGEVNQDDVHRTTANNASAVTLSATDVVGGTLLKARADYNKHATGNGYEFHVSESAGFTPSSSTLARTGDGDQVVLADLKPGRQHYAKVIPHGRNASKIIRGLPSAELSFIAGRASTGHIHQGIALGDYPLNGGFETRLDTADMPDHWSLWVGSYSTNILVMEDGNGLSGKRYLRLKGATVRSAIYPVIQEANESSRRGLLYRVSFWRKVGSSASSTGFDLGVRFLDYQDNEVATTSIVASGMPVDKSGHWVLMEYFVRIKEGDSTTRGLQLQIGGNATGAGGTGANAQIDIDEVRCQLIGTPWYEVGDTTYFTENYEAIPAFANGWTNFDGFHQNAAFRKDQFGTVHLKGLIRSGTINTAAFTLPLGFRPPKNCLFAVIDGLDAARRLSVNSAGTVIPVNGNTGYFSLDGVYFMTTEVANTLT